MRIRNGLPTNHGAWFKFQHANVNEADNELTWGSEELPAAAGTLLMLQPNLAGNIGHRMAGGMQ